MDLPWDITHTDQLPSAELNELFSARCVVRFSKLSGFALHPSLSARGQETPCPVGSGLNLVEISLTVMLQKTLSSKLQSWEVHENTAIFSLSLFQNFMSTIFHFF